MNATLLEATEKFGTPLYVYDAETIARKYETFTSAFDVKHLSVHYACKALGNPHILKLMKSLGAHVDTVSINEIQLAMMAGFSAEEIIYTPNMISIEELEQAITWGVQMNIGNIRLLEYIGQNHPDLPVGIRINPHIMAGGHKKIMTGHIDSKFGISIHQLPLIRRLVETLDMNIVGIHMHNGSDILDSRVFMQAADVLFNVALEFADKLEYLDFGSGFKVKYRDEDIETDIISLGKLMSEKFNSYCKEINRDLKLYFEPGKYLVSEAGYFLCRCNQVKQTTSTVFIGVNTGFNHLIRPMFYDAHHDIINLSSTSTDKRVYTVVGHICETDTFGVNRYMPETKSGDILCIKNAGAYCYEMSSNYNAHGRPPEVLYVDGKLKLIRKRETLDDLLELVPEFNEVAVS